MDNKTRNYVLAMIVLAILVVIVAAVKWPSLPPPVKEYNEIYVSSEVMKVQYAFNIDVRCTPKDPIKGWESIMYFNPDVLQVQWIKEGDYMVTYPSFFSPNYEVDNVHGSITKVYGVIIGANATTQIPCELYTVRFHAIAEGISPIIITETRLCAENAYLNDMHITNGQVVVEP
jgi:hypothetical protein